MARILVVDDEAPVRDLFRRILEGDGHAITAAEDGESGLRAVVGGDFDLVITDLIMPKKGGIVFIKELRAEKPGLPVVAVSGGGRTGRFNFLPVARTYTDVWVLKKPFRPSALLELVRGILDGTAPPAQEGDCAGVGLG